MLTRLKKINIIFLNYLCKKLLKIFLKEMVQLKKKFTFPDTYVIIVIMMIIAIALTWIIPAGQFES